MPRATTRVIAAFLIAGGALTAKPAYADAPSDADALIAKGVDLREKGRDDEALNAFRQALAKAPSARARAQVGLAEQALGMWVLAETDLTAALGSESDPWIVKNKAALEGALGVVRKHVATLEVRGAERAEVFLDGVKIGAGTGPFRVEAGRRSLEVRAPGFQSTARSVELPPGGIARETVTLVAAPTPPPAPASTATRESGSTEKSVQQTPSRDPGAGQRVLGWAFVGTGAALLATGGVSLFVRNGIIDDYNRACPGVGVTQPASCEDQISSSRTWFTVAVVTLIGGGVLAAGGAVLVVTAPSATTGKASAAGGRPRHQFGCAPALGTSGEAATLTCAGAF